MSQAKVFVTRQLPEPAHSRIKEAVQTEIWPHQLPPERTTLLEKVAGKEGLLCLLTDPIDGEVMDAAGSQLKVISNCAVGVDNIDVQAATARGIPVGNTPGILTETTADFAFSLLMAAARRVPEGDQHVRAGKWQTWGLTLLLGQDIAGATLGLVGFGRIGKAVARRAAGFNMRVLYYDPEHEPHPDDPPAQKVTLNELLSQSDFVSLHTPLNQDTFHLMGAEEFSQMKSDAILVNTARGPVVDSQALYRALKERQIGGAALDVTDPEPLPAAHPLLTLDNLIVTPHIASASRATRGKMAQMAVDNLLAGLNGTPLPNCVNPQVYKT
jgi:glyoxylate reductase